MANRAGHPEPDLMLPAPVETMEFFELLAGLEAGGLRFGRAGRPADEPARLGQSARLAFATRDVASLEPRQNGAPPRIEVALIGLLGPEGPMPLHITRWVMARLAQRWFGDDGATATADSAFLDFCNLMQHRQIALYWRAWADARPAVRLPQDGGGRLGALVAALAGVGLPGAEAGPDAASLASLKRSQATTLGHAVNAPERLTGLLSRLLEAPVRLVEFVGEWVAIPETLQSRLGRRHSSLGRSAVIGPRSFQRQMRAELRVGPLGLDRFAELFEPDGLRARLVHAIRFVAGREIEFDLRLVLAAAEAPEPRLGHCRLSRTTWIGRMSGRDLDDLRIARVTGDARAAA